MANLKNTRAFRESTDGRWVTVGHNRQVANDGNEVRCLLHGHEIVRVNYEERKLTLHTHGFRSVTTGAAMRDFMGQIDIIGPANVSFAKGEFTARICGVDYSAGSSEMIEIDL